MRGIDDDVTTAGGVQVIQLYEHTQGVCDRHRSQLESHDSQA
jgi:hypothetical protein